MSEKEKKELTKEQVEYIMDSIYNGCGHHSKYLGFFMDKEEDEKE